MTAALWLSSRFVRYDWTSFWICVGFCLLLDAVHHVCGFCGWRNRFGMWRLENAATFTCHRFLFPLRFPSSFIDFFLWFQIWIFFTISKIISTFISKTKTASLFQFYILRRFSAISFMEKFAWVERENFSDPILLSYIKSEEYQYTCRDSFVTLFILFFQEKKRRVNWWFEAVKRKRRGWIFNDNFFIFSSVDER